VVDKKSKKKLKKYLVVEKVVVSLHPLSEGKRGKERGVESLSEVRKFFDRLGRQEAQIMEMIWNCNVKKTKGLGKARV